MSVGRDHAWANVYVGEPLVPSLKIDASVTIRTDGGDQLTGRIAFVSPQAEFTPRNVQTVQGRKTTVFAVKLSIANPDGKLKPGMPADVKFGQ